MTCGHVMMYICHRNNIPVIYVYTAIKKRLACNNVDENRPEQYFAVREKIAFRVRGCPYCSWLLTLLFSIVQPEQYC